jgi:hypothetical protein
MSGLTAETIGPRQPRLLDRVRLAVRARHYSPRTEKAYVGWIRRFIFFHGVRHPEHMGEAEVTQFLSSLATRGKVSASTQNQALAALLFLYRNVLGRDLAWLQDVVRAKTTRAPPGRALPRGSDCSSSATPRNSVADGFIDVRVRLAAH